jgi:acid phosphatase family membrane protein YuiD
MDIIIVSICASLISQFLKAFFHQTNKKRFDLRAVVNTGGMPSSHSSVVTALATSVAFVDGINSVTFAISAVLAVIVMYDAAGLRASVGKQAVVINLIVKELEELEQIAKEHDLHELVGHTIFQVIIGACIGVAVSFTWFLFLAP